MAQEKKISQKAATKTAKKAVKKAAVKKAAAKASVAALPVTTVVAKVDISYGNTLHVRGEGADLAWTEGRPMDNVAADEWVFRTDRANSGLVFKFLINDEIWSLGPDLTVPAGGTSISSPTFG